MNEHTGSGCGSHDKCPPNRTSDTVKSKSGECNVQPFFVEGEIENRVVLADLVVQTQVEADIKLPTYASAIKHIKKNVKLTQCKVIRDALNTADDTAKLFIEGYVHKNIQYAEDGHGCLKDYSVNVPFKCYQRVPLSNPALYPFGEFSIKNNVLERRELAKDGMGADDCTTGSLHFEIFTEPVQCKLLFAIIDEWDIFDNHDSYGRFNKITEKMDVVLGIKLFQLQQDPTPFPTPTSFNGDDNGFTPQPTLSNFLRNIVGR